jgi:hypothetical protein
LQAPKVLPKQHACEVCSEPAMEQALHGFRPATCLMKPDRSILTQIPASQGRTKAHRPYDRSSGRWLWTGLDCPEVQALNEKAVLELPRTRVVFFADPAKTMFTAKILIHFPEISSVYVLQAQPCTARLVQQTKQMQVGPYASTV